MRYDSYSYLWPPRPDVAINVQNIGEMERKGFVAQCKKNGTCSVIFVSPDKKIITKTRHNEDHKQWMPVPGMMDAFTQLEGDGWFVFVAELMHNKTKDIKDVHYVHDILVHNGRQLVGVTQQDRQDMLLDLFLTGDEYETETHSVVNKHLWLPIEYESGFVDLFRNLTNSEDEGLVFKNPNAPLNICFRPNSNSDGQFKCRKRTKNYSF